MQGNSNSPQISSMAVIVSQPIIKFVTKKKLMTAHSETPHGQNAALGCSVQCQDRTNRQRITQKYLFFQENTGNVPLNLIN